MVTDSDSVTGPVIAGTKTVCFSSSSDFTGAPADAMHITVSSFRDVMNTCFASGPRHFLKRGDTFTNTSPHDFTTSGETILVAFGVSTITDVHGIVSSHPVAAVTAGIDVLCFLRDDLRVMGITAMESSGT